MFRGATTLSLDDKGRIAIPSKYRSLLLADAEGKMVCTIDSKQPCLLLYAMPDWKVVEKRLSGLSSFVPAERRLQRLVLGHADDCDMDKNGRVLLATTLRNHASLSKKVMLIGQLNKFEIWDEETWYEQIAQDIEAEQAGDSAQTERLQDFSL
ncbi:cell division/cell wall cluster transcriptional repressor MraZ [Aliidiomarina minuta]|uniref:Transcriptional regulator MraZ n=1 Tax=Aliidiomarina minuta TaxID=880057 RepID=A0A432W960_9GAMM|nr:division/cell wall cluster transcriptional repressor MraZ [Aliidiomarina minuta]RUO26629.1 cell division/cell wall cluster transcriptional repressor MraZ [Aliidiomarina minuta]